MSGGERRDVLVELALAPVSPGDHAVLDIVCMFRQVWAEGRATTGGRGLGTREETLCLRFRPLVEKLGGSMMMMMITMTVSGVGGGG
jgi:hypothetical protein